MFKSIIPHHQLTLCLLLAACLFTSCSDSPEQSKCDSLRNNVPDIRGIYLGMTPSEFRNSFSVAEQSGSSSLQEINLNNPNEDGAVVVPTESTTFREGGRVFSLEKGTAHVGQLLFVDGRVAHFRMIYQDHTDQINWESVDQFVEKTAASLGLPTSWKSKEALQLKENRELWEAKYELLWPTVEIYDHYWHPSDRSEPERFLLCGDILISAGVPLPGKQWWTNAAFIQFDDLAALRKLKAQMTDRRAKERNEESERREGFKP